MAVANGNTKKINIVRLLLRFAMTILIIGIMVVFYFVVVYGVKKAANYSYDFAYDIFGNETVDPAPGRDVKVKIVKGESSMNVASKLQDSKIIANKYSFYLKMKLKKAEIMPGTFVLNTSMTYDQVVDTITDYTKSIEQEQTVEETESSP